MSIPLTPQYDPKSLYTDGCTSPACQAMLHAPSSLTQGREFAAMTRNLHGGRRRRSGRRTMHRKRSTHRRNSRRNSRRTSRLQHGGVADYPSQLGEILPMSMHKAADVAQLDADFAQLPSFVGKYGGVGGRRSRRGSRKHRGRKHRGGGFGYTPGPAVGSDMILSPAEEPKAFLNPQWYTENEVVPSFKGPINAFAQQSYNNQFNYAQRAGSRKAHRKGRKAHRKSRNRKH